MPPHRHTNRVASLSLVLVAVVVACTEPSGPDTKPKEIVLTSVDTLRSIGATVSLSAAVRNASGETLPSAVLSWESTNSGIVTVSSAGLATAVSNGSVYVRARSSDALDSIQVVVRQRISLDKSVLSPSRELLFVDDTVQITLQLRDELGNRITFGGANVFITRSGGTASGMMLPTVDRGDGTYTSGFIGSPLGTDAEVTARVNGTLITSASPKMKVIGFTKLAAYSSYTILTCGLITTGDLYCWGQQTGGLRGTGEPGLTSPSPTLVGGGHRWTDVDIGVESVCGITDNAKLYCWGEATGGALGIGVNGGHFHSPVAVLPESSFVALDLGTARGHCAITTGHIAMCWSSGTWGRLGNGADTTVYKPVAVSGANRFAGIASSFSGSCGVTDAGAAMCWGNSATLGIGFGPFPDICTVAVPCGKTPVSVAGSFTFKPIIFHSGNNVCAIGTNNKTYCWGRWFSVPTELAGAPIFTSLATADWDHCGVSQSGLAYCWGANQSGRFGANRDQADVRVPQPVGEGKRFTQLAMGYTHMCGVATDGNAWCWGTNERGELGDRTTTASDTPVRVKLFAP